MDKVTAGQDTRALLQSEGEGLSSGIGAAEQGSGHQGLEAALLRLKPTFATVSLHGSAYISFVPHLTAVKHRGKSGVTSKGWWRCQPLLSCVLRAAEKGRGLQPASASDGSIRVYWDELVP